MRTAVAWQLIVNRGTGAWGTEYNPADDVGRIKNAVAEKGPPAPAPAPVPVRNDGFGEPARKASDATRAAHAELDREASALGGTASPSTSDVPAAHPDGEGEHDVGPTQGPTLAVHGDARVMMESRGPPRAFGSRADGLFALRYGEPRPCGDTPAAEKSGESCESLVDYLYDPSGKFLREEVVEQQKSGGKPVAHPRIDNRGAKDDE